MARCTTSLLTHPKDDILVRPSLILTQPEYFWTKRTGNWIPFCSHANERTALFRTNPNHMVLPQTLLLYSISTMQSLNKRRFLFEYWGSCFHLSLVFKCRFAHHKRAKVEFFPSRFITHGCNIETIWPSDNVTIPLWIISIIHSWWDSRFIYSCFVSNHTIIIYTPVDFLSTEHGKVAE